MACLMLCLEGAAVPSEKPVPGAVPRALPSGQCLASQG